MMRVRMTQHPVGQGGLFYGHIRHRDGGLKWIYDCGSKDQVELKREIDRISNLCNGTINALYLSHFHADHIDGINYLTQSVGKNIKVEDVIMPYLDQFERIAILAQHEVDGISLTNEIKEFIINTEQFLFERGVDRIIMVNHRDSDEEDGLYTTSPEPMEPDDRTRYEDSKKDDGVPSEDHKLVQFWNPKLKNLEYPPDSTKILCKANDVAVLEIDVSELMSIRHKYRWAFVPHTRSIFGNELSSFKIEIRNIIEEFGIKETVDVIKDENQECFNKIVKCYNEIWKNGNQNSISMSLYIGPQKDQGLTEFLHIVNAVYTHGAIFVRASRLIYRVFHSFPYWLHWRYHANLADIKSFGESKCGGWLLTGDSVLNNTKDYRSQFEQKYQDYMPHVNVLMVPHHGSKNNVSKEFFDFFKNLDVCYVSSNPIKYNKHPDSVVENMVPKSILFHKVDTSSESILEVNCDVYDFW